jgi:hypothetical protein
MLAERHLRDTRVFFSHATWFVVTNIPERDVAVVRARTRTTGTGGTGGG